MSNTSQLHPKHNTPQHFVNLTPTPGRKGFMLWLSKSSSEAYINKLCSIIPIFLTALTGYSMGKKKKGTATWPVGNRVPEPLPGISKAIAVWQLAQDQEAGLVSADQQQHTDHCQRQISLASRHKQMPDHPPTDSPARLQPVECRAGMRTHENSQPGPQNRTQHLIKPIGSHAPS